jgi:hypothetical protein
MIMMMCEQPTFLYDLVQDESEISFFLHVCWNEKGADFESQRDKEDV